MVDCQARGVPGQPEKLGFARVGVPVSLFLGQM